MSAEIIPLRVSHLRRDGWREQGRGEALGPLSDFIGTRQGSRKRIESKFATHLRARPASEATVYRYHNAGWHLMEFLGDVDVTAIRRGDVERFITARMQTTAGSTVAGTYVALEQCFKFVALEVAPDPFVSPTAAMTAPRFEERAIEVPEADFLAAVIQHARAERDAQARTFEGIRDEAMLRMFVDTGARLSELVGLRLHDILGDRIRVTGKSKGAGPVQRDVCLSETTQAALKRYLRARGAHPRSNDDALWLGRRGAMTPSGARQMVWRRSLACGARIHPHQFRHAFAHGWKADPSQSDSDLMEIMGWRTETMLRRYGKAAAAERALTAHERFLRTRAGKGT